MLTLIALVAFACVACRAALWMLGIAFRITGWTLRMVLSVALLPLWIVLFVLAGLATALQVIVPIALVIFVISLFVPEE